MGGINGEEDLNQALIEDTSRTERGAREETRDLALSVWIETKKLWNILGPAIFCRITGYSMNVISQAFAGHLGDVELAAFSLALNVIIGFSYGLLLGMASALETLCGQAFGAKRYDMMGIYLQRSWIILFICSLLLLPIYIFAAPIVKLLGQSEAVAEQTGVAALWMIPLHFSFVFQFPMQRFLQSQLKNAVIVWVSLAGLIASAIASWVFVSVFNWGVAGASLAMGLSWWVLVFGQFGYAAFGGCPLSWTGFSIKAFSDLWDFVKLSAASGVMLCLEFWYNRMLLLLTGYLKNATIAVDALSICIAITTWEFMIPLAFLAATGIRVANELGARNGKAAKFATTVSVAQSTIIGLFFCLVVLIFHHDISYIFTSSAEVVDAVDNLTFLLAATILLNSVQPVLSGVAVGSGWQATVAYVNLGCYYVIGLPLGVLLGWVCQWGVMGIWGGMIFGGTATQTAILCFITARCNWEKEAEKTQLRIQKLSAPNNRDERPATDEVKSQKE